jgi:hypothetical protein
MAAKKGAEVVTLVMDGGTAYVMVMILGMTIANAEKADLPGAPREVLIYAHNELAGQLGMDLYE